MSGGEKIHPLHGNQALAVDPADSVWLSASAGTGKTQVLSSRVLRLLLQPDVEPSQILCLTFTKAGATEMAARVNETLAQWVRLPDVELFPRLEAIGARADAESMARARTLFAKVLDCPGGGLRIDTIHAFSQWLLAAFPHEAGLAPGVRAMEDRDRALLFRQVLADLLLDAEARGDAALLDAVALLSLRKGADEVERFLLRCAEARDAWFGPGGWVPPLRPRVQQLLRMPPDADAAWVADACSNSAFDVASLRRCMDVNAQWKAKTGADTANAIGDWLSRDDAARAASIDALYALFHTQKGTLRSSSSQEKIDPDYASYSARVSASIEAVRERAGLLALAEWLTPALTLGRAFALAWDEAKTREGFIDFDDQIRQAAALLNRSELAEWIRYKLDRRFDHILIDEAQDTNAAQWRIIGALSGDFFAGEGAHGQKLRTIFVVGDYKQAIFRFQGTSPENFETARRGFRNLMRGAAENARSLRGNAQARELQELGLGRSFRTAQSVLEFVDAAIRSIGHENFGLPDPPEAHIGEERPGRVVLWRPVGVAGDEEDVAEEADEGTDTWLSKPERELADRIALQVRRWMDDGFPLIKGGVRRATAGDVMVLVRKRRELAGLIVARLHAAGVPVAGVDRLRLGAPLAVRDLVAALRFAAQPLDDLNLACLLVSPLIGWTQEQLLEHGYRAPREHLWDHLRRTTHPDVAVAMAQLTGLLTLADYEPPHALIQWILSGPWAGRRKLVARLGRESNDPIDELVNAAFAFSASDTPSLAGFLAWFDAGEGELKREAGKSEGQVRVMTVHGSKGLQAPIVILADAAGNPDSARTRALALPDGDALADGEPRRIPLPPLSREEERGPIAEVKAISERDERQEHWRLLYVAMTRAEEALCVTGSLGVREKAPADDSWYARLALLFGEDGWVADDLWGARAEWGSAAEAALPSPVPAVDAPVDAPVDARVEADLPSWLIRPAAQEPRPARPLAPSALAEDISSDPPTPSGAARAAAQRGIVLHKLLERLPDVPAGRRADAARTWAARMAAAMDERERSELVDAALAVVSHPEWADLFAEGALAEVPIAALVGTRVVAGTIDRLLIEPERIRLVDFKTTRRPPSSIEEVPEATLRQMAAYVAALETTYPERRVEASVLYTYGPQIFRLPADRLDCHKPTLAGEQESFSS